MNAILPIDRGQLIVTLIISAHIRVYGPQVWGADVFASSDYAEEHIIAHIKQVEEFLGGWTVQGESKLDKQSQRERYPLCFS